MRLPVLLVLAACSAPRVVAPPPSAPTPEPPEHPSRRTDARVPGLVDPPLVPDVTYPPQVLGVRWLPRSPSLEPHADLAVLYGTTRPWTSLCAARGVPRSVDPDEASEYVLAWCDARSGDARARERIAALRQARSPAIAEAARWDTVDLAAEFAPDVATAMRQAGDPEALAATYIELGRSAEARIVLDALARRSRPSCRQTALALALGRPHDSDALRARVQWTSDPVCAQLHEDLTCPLVTGTWPRIECRRAQCALAQVVEASRQCATLLRDRPELGSVLIRDGIVVRWPLREDTPAGWLAIARAALATVELPEGLPLVLAALQNAAIVTRD